MLRVFVVTSLCAAMLAGVGNDEERWRTRMAEKMPFLLSENIKDAQGRRPTDPDYDPRTLLVPGNWFKQNKVGIAWIAVGSLRCCSLWTVGNRCGLHKNH